MQNLLTPHQIKQAFACALLSKIAYGGECKEQKILLAMAGYEMMGGYEKNGTEFVVAQSRDHQIIAFRGSSELSDIIADAKAQLQTPTPFGRVGAGFEKYVDQVYDEVVSTALMSTREVTFTGHSLGGAAALYMAAAVQYSEDERFDVCTFGCPRVGDRRFAFNINRHFPFPFHQRWVNANDIVPKIPWQMGRFAHPNALQYITTSGEIWTSPSLFQMILNRWGWFKRSPFRWATDQIADHSIDEYIAAIERVVTL